MVWLVSIVSILPKCYNLGPPSCIIASQLGCRITGRHLVPFASDCDAVAVAVLALCGCSLESQGRGKGWSKRFDKPYSHHELSLIIFDIHDVIIYLYIDVSTRIRIHEPYIVKSELKPTLRSWKHRLWDLVIPFSGACSLLDAAWMQTMQRNETWSPGTC